MLTEEERST